MTEVYLTLGGNRQHNSDTFYYSQMLDNQIFIILSTQKMEIKRIKMM